VPLPTVERFQRASIFLVAALPAWVALDPPADVVPLTAFSGALFGGCFFVALVVGLWRKRPGRNSVPVSIFVGAVGVLGWFLAQQQGLVSSDVHPVIVSLGTSLSAYVLAEYFGGRENQAV